MVLELIDILSISRDHKIEHIYKNIIIAEFVHVLCSEKVGEGNKKKPAAKKNKKDRKTREKSKDNKENQQQMDGLLKGEKPKEVLYADPFFITY